VRRLISKKKIVAAKFEPPHVGSYKNKKRGGNFFPPRLEF
jgi:hypothetical protein